MREGEKEEAVCALGLLFVVLGGSTTTARELPFGIKVW